MAAYLQELAHRKQADPRIGELLGHGRAGRLGGRAGRQPARVAPRLRPGDEAAGTSLVRRRAELTAQANNVWQESRAASNFSRVRAAPAASSSR